MKRISDAIDFIHALGHLTYFLFRSRQVHYFEEVDEALEKDHCILFLTELLLVEGGIEFKVVH
jgi:hypothetical protein